LQIPCLERIIISLSYLFYNPEIIEVSYKLKKIIPDYIDCVIVATAAVLKEDLSAEDTLILTHREAITEKYGVKVLSFKDVVK
jgi:hypothetical protein